jgi:hypothetical protein
MDCSKKCVLWFLVMKKHVKQVELCKSILEKNVGDISRFSWRFIQSSWRTCIELMSRAHPLSIHSLCLQSTADHLKLWKRSNKTPMWYMVDVFKICNIRAISHTGQEPWPWNCESPKRKCPKAVPTHLQNLLMWSWALKCSVKSYVTRPSTKYYFNKFIFM